MSWQQVLADVLVWQDSCNVYAVVGPEGTLIVDAGTGQWLDGVGELPRPPVALVCTHFFRDHSAGAVRAARAGIPVYVPEGEREIFANPVQHFRARDTYIIYDNYWDLFAPIEGVPVAGVLRDHERLALAGLNLTVLPLPGVTITQAGLALARPDGGPVVFCGEAVHSPGRMARIAPLQYNYNDLGGAVVAYGTARDLRRLQPAALLPSLGVPMLAGCDAALADLQDSLRALCAGRPSEAGAIAALDRDPLVQVTDHVWMTTTSESINWFVISASGKALVLDYGYDNARRMLAPAYSKPYRRRALLHSIDGLRQRFGIDRVDVALISHFHDDHVSGVPLLQRLHGTQCWASEAFADLLEHPDAHCFPCDWPQPIRVDRRLPLDAPVRWEEYTFHFGPMNGHTRFAALIGFEADGRRFAHTGDQYFFLDQQGTSPTDFRTWADKRIMQNHVYRNGALLNGYAQSAAWLRAWQPEIVLSGHQKPMYTDPDFFRLVDSWAEEYAALHRHAMVLGDDETHFNLDSWGGWIWPYRTHLAEAATVEVTATVRNPLPHPATLHVRLVGPSGWEGTSATAPVEPRAEAAFRLRITPDGPCRRQPFAVELTADRRPYGQVAEALLTVGGDMF
ncbi:MAG TPA: MBL fold metallo-hydrolase [Herpetosiphonaceae bacterium]|nr:MBL fold metallo-hydrolase [Herpetosiphonaceae bacterium]